MTGAALELSGALRDELVANSIDPTSVPRRFSTLKLMAKSPAHYLHAVQRGYDETLSMRIGSGAHAILFDQPYSVYLGKTRAGKAWEEFEAAHPGLILNQKEHAESQAMVASIRAHETAMRLLFTGTVVEKRIDWEWQGRPFRSTPDAAGRTHCVDLKCLRSSDPERVRFQSRNMHYEAQAALYRRALNAAGHSIHESYLVVVENKAPYPVTVFQFAPNALEHGDRSCAQWMERLIRCEASGRYPGYVDQIVDLDVPITMDEFVFEDEET